MKKNLILFVLILFSIHSKAQWHILTTFNRSTPFGYGNLGSKCFCTADSGMYSMSQFLSNTSGTYVQQNVTYDAGLHWPVISSGTIAPGYNSGDAGSQSIKNTKIVYKLGFSNQGGYYVSASLDCGAAWVSRGNLGHTGGFFFPLDSNSYFFTAGKIFKKYDYLVDPFLPFVVDSFTNHTPYLLFFNDSLNGYLISSDSISLNHHLIYKTTQGGRSWSLVYSDTTKNFNNIVFTSLNTGYVLGDRGVFLKTIDGGANWQDLSLGVNKNLYTMDYFNDSVFVIGSDSGFVITTINGGVSFKTENTGFSTTVSRLYCFRDSLIYAISGGTVYTRFFSVTSANTISDPKEQIKIYPNPNSGECHISLPKELLHEKEINLTIYDDIGQLIQSVFLPTNEINVKLNFKFKRSGIYFFYISNQSKRYSGKFVFTVDESN